MRRLNDPAFKVARSRCAGDHEATKRDPIAWRSLRYVGQQIEINEDGSESTTHAIEMRDCACGSTLCKVIEIGGGK